MQCGVQYRPMQHQPQYQTPQQDHQQMYPYKETPTGAVPKGAQYPNPPQQPMQQSMQTVQIESNKETPKHQSKAMTKTYQTIREMISSRFTKSNNAKDPNGVDIEKSDEGLNNVTDELRKSNRSVEMTPDDPERHITSILKKPAGEQGIYGKPRICETPQQQMIHHVYQPVSGYQMLPGRSQEQMRVIQQDQMQYYQMQQRVVNRYGQEQYQTPQHYIEPPRSAQQLERESIRQRSFMEARRAASQPHLASCVDEGTPQSKPMQNQPQVDQSFNRTGSYGNLMETFNAKPIHTHSMESEKESDDGGFIKSADSSHNVDQSTSSETKTEKQLAGTPKLRLEGEIGKIEGVYNLAQCLDRIELDTTETGDKIIDVTQRKLHSALGSDYDKPGSGQSSSNADSGRGSAAYSSGRRQIPDDISPAESSDHNHHQKLSQSNYGTSIGLQNGSEQRGRGVGGDSGWVDTVETEIRHILEQPKLHNRSDVQIANSTLSESISSMTPPLPPLSPGEGSTPNITPRNSTRYKHQR